MLVKIVFFFVLVAKKVEKKKLSVFAFLKQKPTLLHFFLSILRKIFSATRYYPHMNEIRMIFNHKLHFMVLLVKFLALLKLHVFSHFFKFN